MGQALPVEKCRDPQAVARAHFHESLEQNFARHIRALEDRLIGADAGVSRISLVEADDLPCGFARMTMTESRFQAREWLEDAGAWDESMRPLARRELFVIFGSDGAWPDGAVRGSGAREESERHHTCRCRLAIAHELAHLALGHCYSADADGATQVALPEGLEPEDEWAAYAYAVVLVKLTSDYLSGGGAGRDQRIELLKVDLAQVEDELAKRWEKPFWRHPLSKAYVRHLFELDLHAS